MTSERSANRDFDQLVDEQYTRDHQQRSIGNAPNSEIRRRAHLEPLEAAQAIIALRAELDAIYSVVDHSDAALYDAVKKSIARVKQWDQI